MINYLKDCQKTTLIGLLPDIINSNNESIKNEFNWIFDSSANRLTKSVYAPTGSVKSHFGEFVNLACEYITIKNTESLANTILDAVEKAAITETAEFADRDKVLFADYSDGNKIKAAATNVFVTFQYLTQATYDSLYQLHLIKDNVLYIITDAE